MFENTFLHDTEIRMRNDPQYREQVTNEIDQSHYVGKKYLPLRSITNEQHMLDLIYAEYHSKRRRRMLARLIEHYRVLRFNQMARTHKSKLKEMSTKLRDDRKKFVYNMAAELKRITGDECSKKIVK